MLTDRAHPEAPAGVEEPEVHDDDEDEHGVDEDVVPEEDRPQDRDVGEERDGHLAEPLGRVQLVLVRLQDAHRQEAGQPGDQDVDHEAGDDLVDAIPDGEDRQQEGQQRRR